MSDDNNLVSEEQVDTANIPDEANEVEESTALPTQNDETATEDTEKAPEVTEAPKEDPEYIKRRLGKQQKKYERQLAEMNDKLSKAEQLLKTAAPLGTQPQQNIIYDEWSGKAIDATSPQGQEILKYRQEVEENLQKSKQKEIAENFDNQKKGLMNHIDDSFDDARDKYKDFDQKVGGNNLPFDDDMVTAIGLSPNPGELAYYLASNPKEVVRLSKLPAFEKGREIMRHLLEMNNKKTVSKAPPPVKKVGQGAATPNKAWGKETYREVKERKLAEMRKRFQ